MVTTLRVTPAMQAGITDHIWAVDEFLDALLTEPAGEAPKAQALSHREPSAPARKLPSGPGWLRLATEPTPGLKQCRKSEPPPPASPPAQAAPPPPAEPQRGMVQLDLFSWSPGPSDTPEG
ncbi:hypothetical protein WME81_07390 [Sorangium sp. So ce1078]